MRVRSLAVLPVMLAGLFLAASAFAAGEACVKCHATQVSNISASAHSSLECESCHEGAAEHAADSSKAVGRHRPRHRTERPQTRCLRM